MSGKVARAVDLVPAAFGEESEDAANDALEFDIGHMMVTNAATLSREELGPHGPARNAVLRENAQQAAQALINQMWELPVQKTNVGPMVGRACVAWLRSVASDVRVLTPCLCVAAPLPTRSSFLPQSHDCRAQSHSLHPRR